MISDTDTTINVITAGGTILSAIGAIIFAIFQIKDNKKERKVRFALICQNHYMRLFKKVEWFVKFYDENHAEEHSEIVRNLWHEADLSMPNEIIDLTLKILKCTNLIEHPTYNHPENEDGFLNFNSSHVQPESLRKLHLAKSFLADELIVKGILKNTYKRYTRILSST